MCVRSAPPHSPNALAPADPITEHDPRYERLTAEDLGLPPQSPLPLRFRPAERWSPLVVSFPHVGLRWPERLAGVVVLSAYLLMTERTKDERHPANASTPMLFCHGSQDPIVPIWLGKAAHEQIAALDPDRPMSWYDYPMPHAVCPEEIAEIARFLREQLA